MEKTNLILNSTIELVDVQEEGNGKGRPFVSRFIEPGIAHYKELGDILITKETLNKFINTMVGCPVIIEHEDVTDANADKLRVGVVSSVWFNEMDGYFYCEGILTDPEAIDLVKNQGYNVSCAYSFVSDNTKRTHNGKEIDMEFIDGEFLHLALVKDPRYEGANIVVNKKDDDIEWITVSGNHIPIKKGQSKDEAVKEFLEGKGESKQNNKEADIALTMMAQDYEKRGNKGTVDRANELKEKLKKGEELSDKDKQDIKTAIESYKPKDKSGDSGEKGNEKKLKKPKEVKLTEIDKELLKDGNNYHFAEMIAEHYPEEAKKAGMKSYINEYRRYTEYDKDNKEFILRYDNGDKAIFDTNFKLKTYKAYNSIGDITMQVLNELKDFIKSVVSNEKEEEMKEVKNEDKRKLIDEVGGMLKDKIDEELWRTVVGKLEKIAYEPSEDDKADNKAKNEEDEEKEAKNKCKNEEDEEAKEDVTKNEDKSEDDGEDEEEDKSEDKAENKKVKNSMRDMVMGGSSNVQEQKLYISRKERLEEGNKY